MMKRATLAALALLLTSSYFALNTAIAPRRKSPAPAQQPPATIASSSTNCALSSTEDSQTSFGRTAVPVQIQTSVSSTESEACPADLEGSHLVVETLDHAGRPAANVTVDVYSPRGHTYTTALTDAQGQCSLLGVVQGATLYAYKDTLGTSGLWTYRGEAKVALFIEPQVEVEGLVLSTDGLPIPGATITIFQKGFVFGGPTPRLPPDILSGSDGRFSAAIDNTRANICALARYGDLSSQPVHIPTDTPSIVILQLQSPHKSKLRLTSPSGEPLSSGRILLKGLDGDQPKLITVHNTASGADLPLLPNGNYLAVGQHEQYAMGPPLLIAVAENDVPHTIDIAVSTASTLAGYVIDEAGEPLANATLATWPSPISIGGYEIDLQGIYGTGRSSTDSNGWFAIDNLSSGPPAYAIACAPAGTPQGAWVHLDNIAPNTTDISIAITSNDLRRGSVRGNVAVEDGRSIDKYTIFLQRKNGDAWWYDRTIQYEGDSPYVIESLAPGQQYCMLVQGPLGTMPSLIPAWKASADDCEINVTLALPRRLSVSGTDSNGRPCSRLVRVSNTLNHPKASRSVCARTLYDDRVEFSVSPGDYNVFIGDRLVHVAQIDNEQFTHVTVDLSNSSPPNSQHAR